MLVPPGVNELPSHGAHSRAGASIFPSHGSLPSPALAVGHLAFRLLPAAVSPLRPDPVQPPLVGGSSGGIRPKVDPAPATLRLDQLGPVAVARPVLGLALAESRIRLAEVAQASLMLEGGELDDRHEYVRWIEEGVSNSRQSKGSRFRLDTNSRSCPRWAQERRPTPFWPCLGRGLRPFRSSNRCVISCRL